jgi:hypothetical protein
LRNNLIKEVQNSISMAGQKIIFIMLKWQNLDVFEHAKVVFMEEISRTKKILGFASGIKRFCGPH